MAKFKQRRGIRYQALVHHHFTTFEAREFSALPKATPALRALISERDARWERFTRIARRKIGRGAWGRSDVPRKWLLNLSRFYKRKGYVVQYGPKGKQKGPPKGSPSPWEMYREFEERYPGKSYISPWEIKQIKGGGTPFERGQIFIQKAQRTPKGVDRNTMVNQWIHQLTESISMSTGTERAKFIEQRRRLRGELR